MMAGTERHRRIDDEVDTVFFLAVPMAEGW